MIWIIFIIAIFQIALAPPLVTGNRQEMRNLQALGYVILASKIIKDNYKVSLKQITTVEEIEEVMDDLGQALIYLKAAEAEEVSDVYREGLIKRILELDAMMFSRKDQILARLIEILEARQEMRKAA